MAKRKIAVVGAGIFGCTVAWMLKKELNCDVDLWEKSPRHLSAASMVNQYRLHHGYHYPRSTETVEQIKSELKRFKEVYSDMIVPTTRYYAVEKSSKVDKFQYQKFLDKMDLDYEIVPNWLLKGNIDVLFKVQEPGFSHIKMNDVVDEYLEYYAVNPINSQFVVSGVNRYDFVINCTYANLNDILPEDLQEDYQFELVEKVTVNSKYSGRTGIIVIDGDYCCIDPNYGYNNQPHMGGHVLGHVTESIHHRWVGKKMEIPAGYEGYVNTGWAYKNAPISKHKQIIEACSEYFDVTQKMYKHSQFTIRTVLPNREHDDARPTIVKRVNDKIINVFSGKVGTCVSAADEVIKILRNV